MENPYQEDSKSYLVFQLLSSADRPLRPAEIAEAIGEPSASIAHHVIKDLRRKAIRFYRYRDTESHNGAGSLYSLRPVEGLAEVAATAGRERVTRVSKSGPPPSMTPAVKQPLVGSPVRVTGVLLENDDLRARFECDGVVYTGTAPKAQPVVGEWMTLVAVGLHGRGLYVDLAGSRALTLEDITEVDDGEG